MGKLAVTTYETEHVEYTSEWGAKLKGFVIGTRSQREHAEHLLAEGNTDVCLVRERVTYRGKNGKRKHEELSRECL